MIHKAACPTMTKTCTTAIEERETKHGALCSVGPHVSAHTACLLSWTWRAAQSWKRGTCNSYSRERVQWIGLIWKIYSLRSRDLIVNGSARTSPFPSPALGELSFLATGWGDCTRVPRQPCFSVFPSRSRLPWRRGREETTWFRLGKTLPGLRLHFRRLLKL